MHKRFLVHLQLCFVVSFVLCICCFMAPCPHTGLSKQGNPVFLQFWIYSWNHCFDGPNPIENVVCSFCADCRKGRSCVLGCMLACCFVLSYFEGLGWLMCATCILWYVPRGNTGLSKHNSPLFPHFAS